MKQLLLTLALFFAPAIAAAEGDFDLHKLRMQDMADTAGQPVITPVRLRGDRILVEKREHRLTVFSAGKPIRVFRVDLGRGGMGKKLKEGDRLTPEGVYKLDYRNTKSSYHLSLHITYPNKDDREAARKAGVKPGGQIFIHGYDTVEPPLKRWDWTYGCIALLNPEIEELWDLVPDGITVEILP